MSIKYIGGELMPCPFCGKEPHEFRDAYAVSHEKGCYMRRKCTPISSTYLNGPEDYDQWNRRAGEGDAL